jgi:hypothetical protein
MTTPIIKYPLDKTGVSPANLVTGEPQTMVSRPVRAIAPVYGSFFSESLVITDTANNTVLTGTGNNPQYYAAELMELPSRMTGKEVCGIIIITDQTVSNNVTITYQALGGCFSTNLDAIVQILNNINLDDRPVSWGNILNKPPQFPPSSHFHDIGDLYGFEYVTFALERVRQAILLGDAASYDAIYKYIDQQIGNVNTEITEAAATTIQEINAAISAHVQASNPHPQYLLASQAATYPLVRTPTNETPANNATDVSPTGLTLQGDHYYSLYGVAQQAAEFQMSTNAGVVAPLIFDETVGAVNSYTYGDTLASDTTYYWRCRYQDAENNWSAWSTPTMFTSAAIGVRTPTITSPTNAQTNVSQTLTITSTAFATVGTSDTQLSSSWEIWTQPSNAGTLVWSSENDTTHLNSITVPGGELQQLTTYYARMLQTGNTLGASDYSPWIQFTTGSEGVNTPVITYPTSAATGVALAPTITASAFSPYGGSDTQLSANWEIWSTGGTPALVWSSENDTTHLTSITVPINTLAASTTYQVRTQQTGHLFGTSAWSSWIVFTTGNFGVSAPTIGSPPNNSTYTTQTLNIVASAFNAVGTTDTQKSASWEVYTNPAAFPTTIPTSTTLGASIGGGLFGGTVTVNGVQYGVIVAPSNTGETTSMLLSADTTINATSSATDSFANVNELVSVGSSPAISWAQSLSIGSNTDWTVPAVSVLTEVMANLGQGVFSQSGSYITSTFTGGGTDTISTVQWSTGGSPTPVVSTTAKTNASGAVQAVRLVPMQGNTAALVYSSENDTVNLTTIAVPASALTNNTPYQIRVKYTGNALGDSPWSAWCAILYDYPLYPSVIGQAFGGGFYMGDAVINNSIMGMILAPKSSEVTNALLSSSQAITGANSNVNSATDTQAYITYASAHSLTAPAPSAVRALTTGGFNDWVIPARYIMLAINAVANTANTNIASYKSGQSEAFSGNYWTSTFDRTINNYGSYYTPATPQSGGDPIYGETSTFTPETASQWYTNPASSSYPAAFCNSGGAVINVTHGSSFGINPNNNQPGTLNTTNWTCWLLGEGIVGYTPIVPGTDAFWTVYFINATNSAYQVAMATSDVVGNPSDITTSYAVRAVRFISKPVQAVPSGQTFNLTIPTGLNVDVHATALAAGWNGTQALAVTITGNIGSESPTNAALQVTGSFPGGVSITFAAGAKILGMGGNGADTANGYTGNIGSNGGPALSTSVAVTITNNGTIGGGGGGGNGGTNAGDTTSGGGGSGGAGLIPGSYGEGLVNGNNGNNTTGGAGGNSGGFGGNLGQAGGTGGFNSTTSTPGAAIVGNSHITWVTQGTIIGSIT